MQRAEAPCTNFATVVIKLGGSVFTGLGAYRRAADVLAESVRARPNERIVVVVSAEYGQTDELRELAGRITSNPEPGTQDLLWSIGELRSVALLTLCLHETGVAAAGLNIHETGLSVEESTTRLNPLKIRHRLAVASVVVVPGFLARGPSDRVISLGRGASDLTAVVLAAAMGAIRCELVKDVPGYFTADPREDASAKPIGRLTYDEALEMARAGCNLVQPAAIEAAQRSKTTLLVRSLDPEDTQTFVSDHTCIEVSAANTPVRAAS